MTEIPSSLEEAVELFLGRRHRGELVDPKSFSAVHPQLAPERRSGALQAWFACQAESATLSARARAAKRAFSLPMTR